jgi:hypothetical protein
MEIYSITLHIVSRNVWHKYNKYYDRKMDKVDLRTPLQRQRQEREIKIYARYKAIEQQLPEATKWAIYRIIAEEFEMRPQGVRSAIERQKTKGGES